MSENGRVTRCDGLNVTPIPNLCATGRKVAMKLGVRLSPEIREGWEQVILRFESIFHFLTLILIGNKLNKCDLFAPVRSVLPCCYVVS